MTKPIPEGKKGKGIRALKKTAPEVAKKMGYKKGGRVHYAGGGNVATDKTVTISTGKSAPKQPRAQIAGFGKARR